ncbi:response regulator [Actinomadura formosensis]|uniref:response regulator n=1 Tax=Actinomadura formosensis TaxID=60706 RepID=UPI000A98D9DF|nr:response regulator transcription factor [Actinomadura formosensis]
MDDHTLLREALRESLEGEDDLSVVGEAGTGEAALALAERTKPDIVLMDIEMPGQDVVHRLRGIAAVSPASRVIILTMHDDPLLVRGLLERGIRGYLLKSISRVELVSAIRSVRAHDRRIILSVSRESLVQPVREPRTELSERELDVLDLVAQGLSNAQIADRLFIAEGTVKRHLSNVFGKLKAFSRIDAVNKAGAAGLLRARGSSEP